MVDPYDLVLDIVEDQVKRSIESLEKSPENELRMKIKELLKMARRITKKEVKENGEWKTVRYCSEIPFDDHSYFIFTSGWIFVNTGNGGVAVNPNAPKFFSILREEIEKFLRENPNFQSEDFGATKTLVFLMLNDSEELMGRG